MNGVLPEWETYHLISEKVIRTLKKASEEKWSHDQILDWLIESVYDSVEYKELPDHVRKDLSGFISGASAMMRSFHVEYVSSCDGFRYLTGEPFAFMAPV